ncbi:hypothetical protein [Paenibacillus naphthalenovorans]|uniref:hypothetical protein n=1 Tax=Paenibacillus naphthalenovorans TaxID=162209 RepID=UPI003D283074
MAKLNGVQTQAERIQYDGVEYVKSDKDAVAGDIIRFEEGGYDYVTRGAYYEVTRIDDAGDAQIINDEGDEFDTRGDYFIVFKRVEAAADIIEHQGVRYRKVARKAEIGDIVLAVKDGCLINAGDIFVHERRCLLGNAAARENGGNVVELDHNGERKYFVLEPLASAKLPEPEPSRLPDDYVIHNGRLYAKEQREARVGETVIVTDWKEDTHNYHDVNVGEILTVKNVDTFGDIMRVNERHIDAIIGYKNGEYAVLTPAASVTLGGAEYTIEQRKAAVGERVLVVKTVHEKDFVTGDILTVNKIDYDGKYSVGKTYLARAEETVVLTPAATKPERLKVGDYARVIRKTTSFGGSIGDIVKILRNDGHDMYPFKCERIDGFEFDGNPWANGDELERVSAADAEKAEAEPFKVGDTVKFIADHYEHRVGKIAVIREIDEDATDLRYGLNDIHGKRSGWTKRSAIVKVDEEEAKWAAIGRKVGEIKAGDIVRVNGSSAGHKVGTIGVVVKDEQFRNLRVLANGEVRSHHGQLELVAPAESVVDIDASMADTSSY